MTRLHYKDRFQQFYEEAVEAGASDDEAGRVALAKLADHYADMADDARDRERDK